MTTPAVSRLARMASDSHSLLHQADDVVRGHALVRDGALVRMFAEYGLSCDEIARLTGIKDRTVRTVVFRNKGKGSLQFGTVPAEYRDAVRVELTVNGGDQNNAADVARAWAAIQRRNAS